MRSWAAPAGLTVRAVGIGLVLGTLLCFSNMYFGLQTGWVTMAPVQSAVLGYGVAAVASHSYNRCTGRAGVPLTIAENVVIQTVSVASATMPVAAGFVGILPALRLLKSMPNTAQLDGLDVLEGAGNQILWSMAICFLGVFIAVPLRHWSIVQEKLAFPSGLATAAAIASIHGRRLSSEVAGTVNDDSPPHHQATTTETEKHPLMAASPSDGALRPDSSRSPHAALEADVAEGSDNAVEVGAVDTTPLLRVVGLCFMLSGVYVLLAFFVPVMSNIPVASYVGLGSVSAWGWTLTPSPSYVAQGMIMGLHSCLSMAAGAVLGWGVIGPAAAAAGWVDGAHPLAWPNGGKGFILWVALAIMISEAVTALVLIIAPLCLTFGKKGCKRARGRHVAGAAAPRTSVEVSDWASQHSQTVRAHARSSEHQTDVVAIMPVHSHGQTNPPSSQLESPNAAPGTGSATPSGLSTPKQHSDPGVPPSWWVTGLVLSVVVGLAILTPVIHMSFGEAVAALLLSAPIAVVAIRALGETDMNPVSGLGKISQLAFAVLSPGNVVGNILAGAVAEAGAAQAGDLMQDLKTGYLLSVPAISQFYAQLIGSVVSVVAAVAAFAVLDGAFGVPSVKLPAPTASVWVTMAQLTNGGHIPDQVIPIALSLGLCTCAVTVAEMWVTRVRNASAYSHTAVIQSRLFRFVSAVLPYTPSPTAMAIGMYVTANWTLPRVVGALGSLLWGRLRPTSHATYMIMVATGFVLGEGIISLLIAGLTSAGARPITCAGCEVGQCGNMCP